MFCHVLKCSNLGVIKQLAIVKGGIQVCQSTRYLWNVHYKDPGSPHGQTEKLQKEKGEKGVRKG